MAKKRCSKCGDALTLEVTKSMKKLITFIILALFTLGGLFSIYVVLKKPVQPVPPAPVDCSVTDKDVIKSLNIARAEIGVPPVIEQGYLNNLSDVRSLELKGVLDHHAGFLRRWHALEYDYVHYSMFFEDLQQWDGCHNSSERLNSFRSSEEHWTSLMDANNDTVGVGFYNNVLVITLGNLR